MFYENSYLWGMHLLWWGALIVLLFWIFLLPFNIPGQRMKKDTPLDILKKQFASGAITKEEYVERKNILIEEQFVS